MYLLCIFLVIRLIRADADVVSNTRVIKYVIDKTNDTRGIQNFSSQGAFVLLQYFDGSQIVDSDKNRSLPIYVSMSIYLSYDV